MINLELWSGDRCLWEAWFPKTRCCNT